MWRTGGTIAANEDSGRQTATNCSAKTSDLMSALSAGRISMTPMSQHLFHVVIHME